MKTLVLSLMAVGLLAGCSENEQPNFFTPSQKIELRAPSNPLVTIDPYTSVWSFTENLYDEPTRHWTGREHDMVGVLTVDGENYRFMGSGDGQTATQTSVNVLPTQTFYTFDCGPINLDLVFTAPFILDDLEPAFTPINYISWQATSTDGKSHKVSFNLEVSSDLAVNDKGQEVESSEGTENGIRFVKTGTTEQNVLGRKGDNVRIDWGYLYLATTDKNKGQLSIGNDNQLVYNDNMGSVGSKGKSNFVMIGYDDLYSIQYFNDNRMAHWKQGGNRTITQAFADFAKDYNSTMTKCANLDKEMLDQTLAVGNKEYSELCALAYRQSIAAHKLVDDAEGNLLFLSKENFSNGSIGTVDVTYPSAPLYLVYNPELLKGMLNPIFYFSESGKWDKPFAAHDVGTYPLANGQTYGEGMPVEESGNMLILTTAIALREGNADYAKKHWETLTTWADYLVSKGLDPENQLCTDDFAGHLAHNANLSIKAIVGIAGYGKLAEMLGDNETAQKYTAIAKDMAAKWEPMAKSGDHYSLTFDKKDSWSQKYNLVWDKLLGLNIFPQEIADKEVAYYLTVQQPYGLPLDSRKTYTKTDWIMWSACLTDNMDSFNQLVAPVYKYANETTTRIPLSDWHETTNGNSVGFRARSVVGGYFMKMLQNEMQK